MIIWRYYDKHKEGVSMESNIFKEVACNEGNPNWEKYIERENQLYGRKDDVRSEFARDYTRILHSLAYRRLKHKTQVFFNIDNDHICTRMEHVAHVESVSSTIAKYLGLNHELTKAIAIGHDLGHAPFGHQGETVLSALMQKYLGEKFWHEKNGLRLADKIDLLEDNYKEYQNMKLTYAVRDGIISHCGEVDENGLRPRDELMDLQYFERPGQYQPATWEGCVVKIADKIAYIGRDIEDAICLGFLDEKVKKRLVRMAQEHDEKSINTTVIMHNLIIDICKNSSPDNGICLSDRFLNQLNELKSFNYDYIYNHKRLKAFKDYSEMIIYNIFDNLLDAYDGKYTWDALKKKIYIHSPTLVISFSKWLARYCNEDIVPAGELEELALRCKNDKIYDELQEEKIYIRAVLDYIAGMTDRFAIKIFNEFLSY